MIKVKELTKLFNSVNTNNIKTFKTKKSIPQNISQTIIYSKISWEKLHDFVHICNHYLLLQLENISLHIYYHNQINIPYSKLLFSIKSGIAIKKYFNIKDHTNIYFVLYPEKRYLPHEDNFVNPQHINSGFTYLHHSSIFIIREEEFSKVILHEILHHCNTIHTEDYSSKNIQKLKSVFNISAKTVLIPNEAVVEFYATLFHSMFLSIETCIPYKILLDIEIKHSIKQSNKIMNKHGDKQWFEKTNSFCYIIFKTIILMNHKKFLQDYIPNSSDFVTNFILQNNNIPKIKINKFDRSLRMTRLS